MFSLNIIEISKVVRFSVAGGMMDLKIRTFSNKAQLPNKINWSDAGFNLYAIETIVIPPKTSLSARTGVGIEIPKKYYGEIIRNQGKAMVFEGVIDSDYKGEIRVLLMNYSARDVVIFNEGDKIAKIVLNEIHQASSLKENEGGSTYEKKNLVQRGQNGFGSTGK